MSQINIDTIADRTGSISTPAEDVIRGSARAFVNFNGTGTVAIRASYNVASITDNGTGNYTINFTNDMPDANYSATGAAGGTAAGTSNISAKPYLYSNASLSLSISSNGVISDIQNINVAIHR